MLQRVALVQFSTVLCLAFAPLSQPQSSAENRSASTSDGETQRRLIPLVVDFERSLMDGDLIEADRLLGEIELRARQLRAAPKGSPIWLAELEISRPANMEARLRESRLIGLRRMESRVLSDPRSRGLWIGVLAFNAAQAEEFDRAREYAEEALHLASQGPASSEKQAYYGNTVLGLLALRDNNIPEASRLLLASTRIATWPDMKHRGPNMQLAKRLLDRSQNDVVLQFLESCKPLWPDGEAKLIHWQSMIRQGKQPIWDFQELETVPAP